MAVYLVDRSVVFENKWRGVMTDDLIGAVRGSVDST